MYCIKLVKLSHRHKQVFFCESIAVKINVNDLHTTGKPYVWKTFLISPPRVLSYKKKWWGAYSSSPKKELEADFVGVAPIHFKRHPRGLLE